MRAIITGLFILILSAIGANAQCVKVETPPKRYVVPGTSGFVPVAIYLRVNVPEGDAAAVAQKAFFRFWISGYYPNIRADSSGNDGRIIQEVNACTIMGDKKTYVQVRTLVDDAATKENGYTLYTGIPLPQRLVDSKPVVGTTLDSGKSYRGTWGHAVLHGHQAATLTFEQID